MARTERTAKSFDAIAEVYDTASTRCKYFAWEWISKHAHDLKELPDCRVLDLGCGTGLNVSAICEQRSGVFAEGVDASPRMLERARATGKYEKLYTYDLHHELPDIASDSYDLVIAFGFLEFLSDVFVCLSECRRVLKVNGTLWASFRRFEAEDPASPPRIARTHGLKMVGYSAAEILQMMINVDMHVTALTPVVGYITAAGFTCPYNVLQAHKTA